MKRSDIKFITSEIVRSMTNEKLTQNQQAALEYKSTIILENLLFKYIEDIPIEIKTKQEVDDAFLKNIEKG